MAKKLRELITAAVINAKGITFVEVICAVLIFGISIAVIWQVLIFAYEGTKSGSYRIEAMAKCQERTEEIKNTAYASITSANFPNDTVTLDTRGTTTTSDDFTASRITSIQTMTTYKVITITVSWVFRNRNYTESVKTIVSAS